MNTRVRWLTLSVLLGLGAPLVLYAGCNDNAVHDPASMVDSGASDGAGGDGATGDGGSSASDCVMNPMTHLEIINACTDAAKIDKKPSLPRLLADGGLPPLP